MTYPFSYFMGRDYHFEWLPTVVNYPENYICHEQYVKYCCERDDVLEANQKVIAMLFDMIKEQSEMKKKVRRLASSHLKTDKLWWEGVGVAEELYQWSKTL